MMHSYEFFEPKTLTGFVKDKEVQAAVLELINLPPDVIKNEAIKAEPKTKRYVITGTAFELYLICRLYREFRKKCLNKINFEIFKQSAKPNKIWKEAWKKAHKEIEKYIEKEIDANDEFLKALIVAANLMCLHRSGAQPLDINQAGPEELQDLKNLMAITPWEKFKPKKYAFLSPQFKCHDSYVVSADGDLIIDDVLIDIKTVQRNDNKILWCQLLGYYYLFHCRGLRASKAAAAKTHISSVGAYFSRHGIMQIADPNKFVKTIADKKENRKYISSIFLNEE